MSNQPPMKKGNNGGSRVSTGDKKPFDLEERTALFGEAIVVFAKSIVLDVVNTVLISQLVRSGASIGANYCEANDAESRKDFRHKIGLCRKESRETMHWLRMIAAAEPPRKKEIRKLWKEAKELNLIFGAIRARTKLSK